jgi:hypothetical protein
MAISKGTKLHQRQMVLASTSGTPSHMAMEDLTEEGHKEIEKELQEEMAEMQKRKLVCF